MRHFLEVSDSTGTYPGYDLRQAVLLGVLAPLACLTAIFVLVLHQWAERSLESRLQGEIELISRAVAPDISRHLSGQREQAMRRNLDAVFSIHPVYGAAVYDDSGDLAVAVGIADQDLSASRAASEVVRTGEEDGSYRRVEGRSVYAYFTPLIDGGGRIHGLLQITRDRREIDASMFRLRAMAWSFWLFAVCLSVLSTLLLYRRLVGAPVRSLLSRMDELASGERRVSFKATSPSEFAAISRGFNSMVASIRRAEHELLQRQRRERKLEFELEASERAAAVGRVAQGLAHELGSPLSVVNGRVRKLERVVHEPDARKQLSSIRRQVARMTGIVHQLLHYGRVERPQQEPIDLGALVRRICETTETEERSLTQLMDPQADLQIAADPLRIELAVTNLIRNALRHSRSEVHAALTREKDRVVLRVSDDGPGVAAQDQPHVFKAFFTSQPPGDGTGLGLAIVATVMDESGGSVSYCQSALGGACFTLSFPGAGCTEPPQ